MFTFRSINVVVDMINSNNNTTTINGSMSPSSSNAQSQGLIKTNFKTPEGRYKICHDKIHPSGLFPYALAKSITQITLAILKDQLAHGVAGTSATLQTSSSFSVASSGVRYVMSKFFGSSSNGS